MSQTNGFHAPDPELIESWPTAAKLSQQVGVSVRTIGRLTQSGHLKRYPAKDGTSRYDPDAAAEAIAAQTQLEAETATTKHVLDGSDSVLRQSLELLRQAHAHIRELQAPAQLALELLRAENVRLSGECTTYHKVHLDLVKAREESLSEAHIRQLEATRMELAEKRRSEIFSSLVTKVAPRVLAQLQLGGEKPAGAAVAAPGAPVAASAAAPAVDGQQAQIDATVRLLGSLSPSQLEGLLVSGFVDDDQAADIRIILNHAPTTVPPAPAEGLRGD